MARQLAGGNDLGQAATKSALEFIQRVEAAFRVAEEEDSEAALKALEQAGQWWRGSLEHHRWHHGARGGQPHQERLGRGPALDRTPTPRLPQPGTPEYTPAGLAWTRLAGSGRWGVHLC